MLLIAVVLLLGALASNLLIPASAYLGGIGFDQGQIGLVMGAFNVASLASMLIIGRVIARVGHGPVLAMAGAAIALGAFTFGLAGVQRAHVALEAALVHQLGEPAARLVDALVRQRERAVADRDEQAGAQILERGQRIERRAVASAKRARRKAADGQEREVRRIDGALLDQLAAVAAVAHEQRARAGAGDAIGLAAIAATQRDRGHGRAADVDCRAWAELDDAREAEARDAGMAARRQHDRRAPRQRGQGRQVQVVAVAVADDGGVDLGEVGGGQAGLDGAPHRPDPATEHWVRHDLRPEVTQQHGGVAGEGHAELGGLDGWHRLERGRARRPQPPHGRQARAARQVLRCDGRLPTAGGHHYCPARCAASCPPSPLRWPTASGRRCCSS